MVECVADEDVRPTADDVRRPIELAVRGTQSAEGVDEYAAEGEPLYPAVAAVGDIQVSAFHGNALRVRELAVAAPERSPSCEKPAAGGELLDAVVARIRHVDPAGRVDGHVGRELELPVACARERRRSPAGPPAGLNFWILWLLYSATNTFPDRSTATP